MVIGVPTFNNIPSISHVKFSNILVNILEYKKSTSLKRRCIMTYYGREILIN